MKRSYSIQAGVAVAAFAMSALLSTTFASAGLVGGITGAAGGVVNGAGGVTGGPLNGTGSGTLNGTLNGTVNGTNGASVNAGASTNASGNGAVGNVLDASFAGSGSASASTSVALPDAGRAMQLAYATMQKEKAAGQLVMTKADRIRGTVTNVENKYVSFVSDKGLTYVAAVKNATKNTLSKGSHIIANAENYGQNVQLMLDTGASVSKQ